MIVYGFEPLTVLDLLPLPLHERVNMDVEKRAENMMKLHEDTRETIDAQVQRQASKLNKNKKPMVFNEGDHVRIHLRKERFPRSEEHTSELQSHYSISYAVFCLKKTIPISICYTISAM